MAMPDYRPGVTSRALEQNGLSPSSLYLELSEHHDLTRASQIEAILTAYRAQGYKLVIDDYGTGFSQLKMLYHCQPDVIKIDRFFVSGIEATSARKMLVAQQVDLAHLMGALVVAEGVETEAEFYVCKRVGCDLVQGYFIQRPTTSLAALQIRYEAIEDLAQRDRRTTRRDDGLLVRSRMTAIQPLPQETPPTEVLRYFQRFRDTRVVPVVDGQHCPVGIIREADFKEFSYSLYGRELLQNPQLRPNLARFLRRCPAIEETEPVERILKVFANADTKEGVIVTRKMSYVGFLEGHALLEMLNEKNTVAARDQNPLTQLPGNNAIYRYVSQVLAARGGPLLRLSRFRQLQAVQRPLRLSTRRSCDPAVRRASEQEADRRKLVRRAYRWRRLLHRGRRPVPDGCPGPDCRSRRGFRHPDHLVLRCRVTGERLYRGGRPLGADPTLPADDGLGGILMLPEVRTTLSVDDVAPAISELKKQAKRRDDHVAIAEIAALGEE
jgi:hypothetical protein